MAGAPCSPRRLGLLYEIFVILGLFLQLGEKVGAPGWALSMSELHTEVAVASVVSVLRLAFLETMLSIAPML